MMSHFSIRGLVCGTMLLITVAPAVQSQEPHSASQTSVVQRLATDTAAAPMGFTRELVCRGKPGIDLRIHRASVPDRPGYVTMVLRYERLKEVHSLVQRGMGNFDGGRSLQFIPGSCTWGGGWPGIPPEPLVVYFDLPRDAQAHAGPGQRDTTAGAAVSYPDVVSVPRYLSDSSRYWIFYVDDASNMSISFRSRELPAPSPAGHISESLRNAAPGSATLTSARVLSDSQRTTVVRAPNTAGGAAGTLRGSGAGATTDAGGGSATTLGDRTVSTDTTARRTATVRPPTPAPAPLAGGGVAQPRPAPGSDTLLSARAITAGSGPGDARTSRTLLPDVRIWGVATAPGSKGVRLVFNTDRKPAVSGTNGIGVQFGRQRPSWDAERRRWAYPPGWESPWYAEIGLPANGGYLAEPRGSLELRQRYYYLITVESNDAALPPRQVVGSFIASNNPFVKAPPAPGPDPASSDDIGDPLRGDATDVAGTLRDQAPGATTAAATTARRAGGAESTAPGTSRTRLPPDVKIWNIETKPGNNGMKLSFQTDRVWVRSSSGVRVQFSTGQPRWEGGLLVSPAVESRAREVVSGWFEAEPHWTLQAGKRYYYLITVDSNDGTLRPRQATGSFLPAFGP
jgi:hypothetical protein